MALLSPARLAAYRGAVPQMLGDPIVTTTTLAPGYAYEIALPQTKNVASWTVQFLRDGVVFQTSQEVPAWEAGGTASTAGYIFTTADVTHVISAIAIAVPVDPALTIDPIALVGVTVSSGGAVTWPAAIDPALVTWAQRDAGVVAGNGRGRAVFSSAIVPNPTGFRLCIYRGQLSADGTLPVYPEFVREFTAAPPVGLSLVPGGVWDPSGGAPFGASDGITLLWKRVSDGILQRMQWGGQDWLLSYQARSGTTTGGGVQPTADVTLGSASIAALTAALNSLPAKGGWRADSEGPYYIIDCPTADYGAFNFSGRVAAADNGRVIIRSQDRANTGAKFRSGQMVLAQGIEFHFCSLDRTGQPQTAVMVNMRASRRCGFRWCDVNFGPNVRNNLAQGWVAQVGTGFDLWVDSGQVAWDPVFFMNYIHGAADKGIVPAGAQRTRIEANVFADMSSDDIQCGELTNYGQFIKNWGSRRRFPTWSAADGWAHTDFIQFNSKNAATPGNSFIGNVLMTNSPVGSWSPNQGIFGSGSIMTNSHVEDNIILTNTPNAIMFAGTAGMAGNRVMRNTSIRLVDDLRFETLHSALVTWGGLAEYTRNVACMTPYEATLIGGDGLKIIMNPTTRDYTASLAYYTNPRATAAGFYDLRPPVGAVTHWGAADGVRQGAANRFKQVLVDGDYPKEGPAAAAWKAQYDPGNLITS